MSVIPITTIVNISVAQPPAGLADYAINNLALFTKEVPNVGVPSVGYFIYRDPLSVADDWGSGSEAYAMANAVFSQEPNILAGQGALIIVPMAGGDTLSSTLVSSAAKIFYGGVIYGGYAPNDAELLAAATAFTAAKKLIFISQYLLTALDGGGVFQVIQAAKEIYARGLLYTVGASEARLFAAAYAGRAMSTDFNGSNTTLTMNLKDLVGITPDPGITGTTYNTCETIGVDTYCYIGPLPKVTSTGGNTYFDQVYGTLWITFAMQVALFNALATTFTKIPQTEPGMDILRNAAIDVLNRAILNGWAAPGAWNSPTTFGDPTTLRRNVLEKGFYVYSLPVNLQSQTQREARIAPLIQIALKLAGAIQKANMIVYLNP